MNVSWQPLLWRIPLTVGATLGATGAIIYLFVSTFSTRETAALVTLAGTAITLAAIVARFALYTPAARARFTSIDGRSAQARAIAGTMVGVSLVWIVAVVALDALSPGREGFGTLQSAAVAGGVLVIAAAILVYGYVRWATPVSLPLVMDNGDPRLPPSVTLIEGDHYGEAATPIALPWSSGSDDGRWLTTTDEIVIVAIDPVVVVAAAVDEATGPTAFHLSPGCDLGCPRAVAIPPGTTIAIVATRSRTTPALWFGKPGTPTVAVPTQAIAVVKDIERDLRGDQLVIPTPQRSWTGGRDYHSLRRSDTP